MTHDKEVNTDDMELIQQGENSLDTFINLMLDKMAKFNANTIPVTIERRGSILEVEFKLVKINGELVKDKATGESK